MQSMLRSKIISLLVILTMLMGGIPGNGMQRVSANVPETIVANPKEHWVYGMGWPLGVELTLTIGSYTAKSTTVVPSWDPTTAAAYFDLTGYVDLVPGAVVTIEGNNVKKSLTITNFAITSVDVATDTFSGIGSPGSSIETVANGFVARRYATAGTDGTWSMGPVPGGFILDAGVSGWTVEWDEDGDYVQEDWRVPNPFFEVRVKNYVIATDWWPVGETVTLQVRGHEFHQTTVVADWDANYTSAQFDTSSVYDIQPGDVVSMTDGKTTKTTIVSRLEITDVDRENDTVRGIAEPGSLTVWACNDPKFCSVRYVTTNSQGYWIADFAHPGPGTDEKTTVDILRGTGIDSSQWDDDGDLTAYGWLITYSIYMPLTIR